MKTFRFEIETGSDTWPIGAKVWYFTWTNERVPAIVIGQGEKNGKLVYDLRHDYPQERHQIERWAYADQLTVRT